MDSPLLASVATTVYDRLEQLGRKCRRIVRPFRYWNWIHLLRIAHAGLCLDGAVIFGSIANRIISGSMFAFLGGGLRLQYVPWLRWHSLAQPRLSLRTRLYYQLQLQQGLTTPSTGAAPAPATSAIDRHQWWWLLYTLVGGGFPFYYILHPTHPATMGGLFQRWVHPAMYWGFLSVYKMVWSTLHAVRFANWLTDPRSSRRSSHRSLQVVPIRAFHDCWSRIKRERILAFQNLRYLHQWSHLRQELADPDNQQLVKALKIENRWVALGPMGAAVQDVVDEALDRAVLRPHQIQELFRRAGHSLPHLTEVSIAMSRSLPLMALKQLLDSAHNLTYLRLDGVALSVTNIQADLVIFGQTLHGLHTTATIHCNSSSDNTVIDNDDNSSDSGIEADDNSDTCINNNNNNPLWMNRRRNLPLQLRTLRLEDCRLEQEERDPELRQRYSMDLLLTPAIFTALTPPTLLALEHLTLWVKCSPISALELSVMLSTNTSLKSLDLHMTRDKSLDDADNDDDDDDGDDNNRGEDGDGHSGDLVDWIIVPLAQVLHYSNTTLQKLSLQVAGDIAPQNNFGGSYKALLDMMKVNESLLHVDLIHSVTQRRIRIPEIDFYAHLNKLDRRAFRLDHKGCHRQKLVETIVSQKHRVDIVYYFLSLNPSLLIHGPQRRRRSHDARRKRC